MLETPEAVFEALRENDRRPHDRHRTVVAEELVEAAAQFEDPGLLATALLELMTAYEFTGEHRKSPVAFARVWDLWEKSPGAFSDWEANAVLWNHKWVATSLLQVPDVALDVVDRWIARTAERYRAAGHGARPAAALRYRAAAHAGTGAAAADAYDLWITRPRDSMSDCVACEARVRAEHHVAIGQDAEALDLWEPVVSGAETCSEEPAASQARALLPLLRQGRTDEARSHHLTGYRQVRGRPGRAEEVGLHLEFCALSGNTARGLEILAENRPLHEATGAPLSRLEFLTGVEVLLRRLVADGRHDTPVAGPPSGTGAGWTAGGLLDRVAAEAADLAGAFDARNGSTAVGERRRARLAAAPLLDTPLQLGLRGTGPAPAAPPTAPPAAETGTTGVAPAHPTPPDDLGELVELARRHDAEGHPAAHRLWDTVTDRVAADGPGPDPLPGPRDRLRAELAEHRATRARHGDNPAEALAACTEAVEAYRSAGLPWHAAAARARAAVTSLSDDGGVPDGIHAELDAALAETEALRNRAAGEPAAEETDCRLRVLHHRVFAAYRDVAARLPEADAEATGRLADRCAELTAAAERHGRLHYTAYVRQYAADLAARGGRLEEAETGMRAALEIFERAGTPWRASRTLGVLGQVLLARGEPARATEVLHRALSGAVRHDDTSFPVGPTHALLARAALDTGDAPGAIRHLSEAAARFDAAEQPGAAAETRLELAEVLTGTGQPADGVAVLESVVRDDGFAALDERLGAQIRLTLGRGLRGLGEDLAAADELLRLADSVAGWPEDRHIHTMVAAEAAAALARADRWDAARTAHRRALDAHAEAPHPVMITEMLREFARLRLSEDGLDAALEDLARADRVVAEAVDTADAEADFTAWYHRGAVHQQRARVYAEAGRPTDALAEAEHAIDTYAEGGEEGEAPRAEASRVAALIEGNGLERPGAAAARLTRAIARCEHAGLADAVRILGELRTAMASRAG